MFLNTNSLFFLVPAAKIPIVVCGTLSLAKQFIRFRVDGETHLRCIVVIESIETADIEAARGDNVDLVTFRDMLVCCDDLISTRQDSASLAVIYYCMFQTINRTSTK